MRKILLTLLLAFITLSANAQFNLGGQFSIKFDNEHTSFSNGTTTDQERAFQIVLKPKVYWNLNENMQVGGRVGFGFGRLTTGMIYDSEKKEQTSTINRALGWSIAPFFGYKLLDWKTVSIWAEANAFVGQNYNVENPNATANVWGRVAEYGFQILPVINIDIKEKLALQIHLGFISLGWYGTREEYANKVVTTSSWDIHKGGFAGLAQGLADYGIGLVKKF